MKTAIQRTLGILTFFLLSFSLAGQVVNIPDPIFKFKLLQHDPIIDLNLDGEIQQSEAEAFSGFMDISYVAGDPGYIHDVTGLEAFINLDEFKASYQQIATIDVSGNSLLRMFDASGNVYTSLSFTNHPLLEAFQSNFGNLESLDISGAPNLIFLNAQGNDLMQIDLSANPNLQGVELDNNPIVSFDFSQNFFLRYLNCQNSGATTLDLSNNPFLISIDCRGNQELTYINVRNGNNEGLNLTGSGPSCHFQDLPLLEMVCLDTIDSPLADFIEEQVEHDVFFMEECVLSVKKTQKEWVTIYPNPVTDILNIHSQNAIQQITMFNLLGQEVFKGISFELETHINFDRFSSGLYLLQVMTNNGVTSNFKILKP